MDSILVSVVIPAFNSEKYIEECIDSILQQSLKNFEIIIVDDGSTDNTVKIISKYNNARIKIFYQKNKGSASARNLGVKNSKGKWVAFLDSDDSWYPEKLEKQLNHCSNFAWSHTDYYYKSNIYPPFTKATNLVMKYSGEILTKLLIENTIATSSVMIKKEVFLKVGGYNENLKALQDWELWLRVAEKFETCYLDEPLMNYRIHSGSVSRSARKTFPYHMQLINNSFSKNGVGYKYKELKKKALSRSCNICAQISGQEKDYSFAIYCTLKSIIYQPLTLHKYLELAKLILKKLMFSIRKK